MIGRNIICITLIVLSMSNSNTALSTKTPKRPIILVPGFAGSQLFAKLNGVVNPPNIFCASNWNSWFLMWLRVDLLIPYAVDCFIHYMQLVYDPITRTTSNRKGVDVKVNDWGDTSSVEYVTGMVKIGPTVYYGKLVDNLVHNYGYERNVSIRGAPYDFRRTPRENKDMIRNMKLLVEQTYTLNQKRRVMLLGHSYGCIYILHFLNQQTPAWKKKYIDSFVSTSGPFGGASRAIMSVSTGDNLQISLINPRTFGKLSRTWPSSYFFLPRKDVWDSKEIVAMTNKRNYTINDFENFFQDSSNPIGHDLYQNVLSAVDLNRAPDVKVHCFYSFDQPTPEIIDWRNKKFPTQEPDFVMGPGDGTVNKRSLNICSEWNKKQKESVNVQLFTTVNHIGIIRSDAWVESVTKLVVS